MTRKDYVLLADALLNARPKSYHAGITACTCRDPDGIAWLTSCCAVADALTKDNPRFDSDRFLTACGVQREQVDA